MFTNRISRFFVAPNPTPARREAAFAAMPPFVIAAQSHATTTHGQSIYQAAWEQAQKQVEAKRQREASSFDWN